MGSIRNEPQKGYFEGLRLKMTLDGNYNKLLRGAKAVITISWSKKHDRFFVTFQDDHYLKLWHSDPCFKAQLETLRDYLAAYKKDVSRLEHLKAALEEIYQD